MKHFPDHFSAKVLDVGSLNITGDVGDLFRASEYVGVDIGPGINVTHVARAEDLEFRTGYFDVTYSGECFEHNPAWKSTLGNMVRMTKPGGLVVMTCASTFRTEHGTSKSDFGQGAPLSVQAGYEYYRNLSPRDLILALDVGLFENFRIFQNWAESDLYFIGLKIGASPESKKSFEDLQADCQLLVKGFNRFHRIIRLQFNSAEWRFRTNVYRRLTRLLGAERYMKIRRGLPFRFL